MNATAAATEIADDAAGSPARVEDAILRAIRSGRLVPGQHLVEVELTRSLGVSRGSLREGFRRLAADGILTMTRHRGAFVAKIDRVDLGHLLGVLEALCGLAAECGAARDDAPEERAALTTAIGALAPFRKGGGSAAFIDSRRDFYAALVALSGNTELGRVIPLARADLFRLQAESFYTPRGRAEHVDDLIAIGEAVLAGKAAAARRAVARHFAHARALAAAMPDEAFLL